MFERITTIVLSEPGASLLGESIGKLLSNFPTPPKSPPTSPLSPQTPLRMENLTSNHPARDISLDTQVDSGNDSEVYSHDLAEKEVTGINTETNTGDNLDGRGDQSGNLSNRLSNLKVNSKD